VSGEPENIHTGFRGPEFREMFKLAKAARQAHEAQSGHGMWLHGRSLLDFHLECFDCYKFSTRARCLASYDGHACVLPADHEPPHVGNISWPEPEAGQ
jgi:hypothetical protein